MITRQQLYHALEVQKTSSAGKYVGEVLIDLGYLTEIDIVTALVLQCNLPYLSIRRHEVDPAIVQLIPAEMARRERMVPLDRIGCVLSVVVSSPLNQAVRTQVESLTGCRVATFVSTRSEIDQAIIRFYGEGK
jgi:type IV pilus assembly protein PilB